MSKKTKTYVLLGIVIAIWGIIGYRITTTLNPKNHELASNETVDFNPKKTIHVDTFSIEITERDPFLGTIYKPKAKKIISKKPSPKPVSWIPISYQGMIKKQKTKKQRIFAVTIENTQYLLEVGQTIKEVNLIKGNAEEITVHYKNQKKTIPVE